METKIEQLLSSLSNKLATIMLFLKRYTKENDDKYVEMSLLPKYLNEYGILYAINYAISVNNNSHLNMMLKKYIIDDVLELMLEIINEEKYNFGEPLTILINDVNHSFRLYSAREKKRCLTPMGLSKIETRDELKTFMLTKFYDFSGAIEDPFNRLFTWTSTVSGHAFYQRMNRRYRSITNKIIRK